MGQNQRAEKSIFLKIRFSAYYRPLFEIFEIFSPISCIDYHLGLILKKNFSEKRFFKNIDFSAHRFRPVWSPVCNLSKAKRMITFSIDTKDCL